MSENQKQVSDAVAQQMIAAYTEIMENFLYVQQDILKSVLLGAGDVSALPSPTVVQQINGNSGANGSNGHTAKSNGYHPPAFEPEAIVITKPEPTATVAQAPAPIAAPPESTPAAPAPSGGLPTKDDLVNSLVELVSDRTGYPAEIIELDLDLEADLGVDSIKRVEILGAFQKQYPAVVDQIEMDDLSEQKSINEIVALVMQEMPESANFNRGGADAPQVSYPFIRTIHNFVAGHHIETGCVLDATETALLWDHTLGRNVSLTNPDLNGLPVMPMMGSLEMMAEAASCLYPLLKVVRIEKAYAYNWVVVEGQTTTRTVAKIKADGVVHCQLFVGKGKSASAEATIIFAPDFADPQQAIQKLNPLTSPEVARWPEGELYVGSAMFHGPQLQGVKSLDAVATDGLTATIEVLPEHDLIPTNPTPNFVLDPVFLDQLAQLAGFWGLHKLNGNSTILPYHMGSVTYFSSRPAPRSRVTCQANIDQFGRNRTRASMNVVAEDGSVWCQITALEGQIFDIPERFYAFSFARSALSLSGDTASLDGIALSQELSLREPAATNPTNEGVLARLTTEEMYPSRFFTAFSGIWLRVLAASVLGPKERQLFRSLNYLPKRKMEWLLARVAAKDAVRQLVAKSGRQLLPADIEILPDENGRPTVCGTWVDESFGEMSVSLAHSNGYATAVLHPTKAVGVDVEPLRDFADDAYEVAFSAEEQVVIGKDSADCWRAWCAKEAVNKAVGQRLGPRKTRVTAVNSNSVTVELGRDDQLETLQVSIDMLNSVVFATLVFHFRESLKTKTASNAGLSS